MTTAHVELLQAMIRNACVSRSEPTPSGSETRNADVLRSIVDVPGVDVELLQPRNGRPSLVARIDGSDHTAPSLALITHTDVVPADPEGWDQNPFGGELVDGEVWGRGAVDMLNQASAMALAMRELSEQGFRPRDSLVFAAVPDEECGGRQGMKPLLEEFAGDVVTDYVLTEVGGATDLARDVPIVEAYTAEKGMMTVVVTVRGTPGHTSIPWGSDNAIVRCAEVVRLLADYRPPTNISPEWKTWVLAQGFPEDVADSLLDAQRSWEVLPSLDLDVARTAHACTHTTVVPAIVAGGEKMGTIPDRVTLRLHVRPCVGEETDEVTAGIRTHLSGIVAPEDVAVASSIAGTRSPPDTALWPTLERVTQALHPGAQLIPSLLPAQTDARYLRPLGITVYGFGVLSRRVTRSEYWSRFHGRNERIDTDSLDTSRIAWTEICRQFLGSAAS